MNPVIGSHDTAKADRPVVVGRIVLSLTALVLPVLGAAAQESPRPTIDSILEEAWRGRGVTPAPLIDDAAFLRRLSLDLIGRVPTEAELKAFERRPDRAAKVDELLSSDGFASFWSDAWTTMLNGRGSPFESNREGLRVWMERRLRDNAPYDVLVTDLLTAEGSSAADGPASFLVRYPQEPAIKVSRLFLGVRLDCARCHDHPFDRWTQEDFRDFSLFFAALNRRYVGPGNVVLEDVPDRARGRSPRFLTGAKPVTRQWRQELALHLVRSRPFARAFANRLWYHFMGRGIVDPPDDVSERNKPSVPALLDHLAEEARRASFDLRAMIRLLVGSDAYRRSSAGTPRDREAERLFAVRVLKPLLPEQFFDSIVTALEYEQARPRRAAFLAAVGGRSLDEDFTNLWAPRESIQATMAKLTIDLPAPSTSVEDLYRRLLSRPPTAAERKACAGRPPEDVVFALVGSNEFFFNH